MVFESLLAQVAGIVAWHKVVHLLLILLVNQYHLYLVFAISDTSIEGNAIQPFGDVGLGYASSYHPLEIHDQIKCYRVNVVGINQHYVFAPFCFSIQVVVHTECKYTNFFAKLQTFRLLFRIIIWFSSYLFVPLHPKLKRSIKKVFKTKCQH